MDYVNAFGIFAVLGAIVLLIVVLVDKLKGRK